jgi:transaldolase / glucose-6-phosphate isomerase
MIEGQTFKPGKDHLDTAEVYSRLEKERFGPRLWSGDASLWSPGTANLNAVGESLGWLRVAGKMAAAVGTLVEFANEVRGAGFSRVVLMGMGGSSMTPLVFRNAFPASDHGLPLSVLDTTDPGSILDVERKAPVGETFFVSSGKSGTTAETSALTDYFFSGVEALKKTRAGENFAAITDPGTALAGSAARRGFRRTFLNFRDIGGRFSALSYFGLVPAALMGIDLEGLLEGAISLERAFSSAEPVSENPGLLLGVWLGALAERGRNKLTFVLPAKLGAFGMWLEQLIAESTGKEGRGILPVVGERIGPPEAYGPDRAFVVVGTFGEDQGALVDPLEAAGFPIIRIRVREMIDLGREFLRWEIATATASAILGINPFDQPNVQESKSRTNRLLGLIERGGDAPGERLPKEREGEGIAGIAAFLESARPGDYVAIQAYLAENPGTDALLEQIRLLIRDRLRLATTVGYGPRFLHSTGQFHKGGPNTGLFLQLTADDPEDIPVPGKPYSFGVLKRAQAKGDLEALRERGRRVHPVHLGPDLARDLETIRGLVERIRQEKP